MKLNNWPLQDGEPDVSGGTPAAPAAVETPVAPPATAGDEKFSGPAGSDVDWEAESLPEGQTPGANAKAPAVIPVAVPPVEPAVAVPPAVPAAVAPVPAAPVPAAVVPPAVVSEAIPPQEPEPQVPAAPPVDMAQLRQNEVTRLTSLYAMNPEDSAAILSDPNTVVPKMLANLHVNVCDAVVSAIMSRLPDAVQTVMQHSSTVKSAEDEFYKQWPQLNDKKFLPGIQASIRAYKQAMPKAPRAEIIRAAGLNVLLVNRLPIPRELMQADPPASAPASTGFQPAAPAGSATPVPARAPTNAFALLNEEFDADERY